MPNYQLTVPFWLELPADTKARLKEIFQIPKSAGASFMQVGGKGILTSDGHTHADLAHITKAKMAAYLGQPEADFFSMFDEVLLKIEEEKKPKTIEVPTAIIEQTTKLADTPPKKKPGRPKKLAAQTA